jgi:hypothetical protein
MLEQDWWWQHQLECGPHLWWVDIDSSKWKLGEWQQEDVFVQMKHKT